LIVAEYGLFECKHVAECVLKGSTTYILFVTKVQVVGIVYNEYV